MKNKTYYVISPPGCYGTYIAKSLQFYCFKEYTDYVMVFDANGSSHNYRRLATNVISRHHDNTKKDMTAELTVVMIPEYENRLDYFNNQFIKQELANLRKFILKMMPMEIFLEKLKQFWNFDGKFEYIPRWMFREYVSLWIEDTMNSGYDVMKYKDVPHQAELNINQLWSEDFNILINDIANKLGLNILVSKEKIIENHRGFLEAQQYHNSQNNVSDWVVQVLNNENVVSPCQTIFDEAYVQHLLREKGYEIKCDGLNEFPTNSQYLKTIIYEAS